MIIALASFAIGFVGNRVLPNVFCIWTGFLFMPFFILGMKLREHKEWKLRNIHTLVYLIADLILFVLWEYLDKQSGTIFMLVDKAVIMKDSLDGNGRTEEVPCKTVRLIFHHIVQAFIDPEPLKDSHTELLMVAVHDMPQLVGKGKTDTVSYGLVFIVNDEILPIELDCSAVLTEKIKTILHLASIGKTIRESAWARAGKTVLTANANSRLNRSPACGDITLWFAMTLAFLSIPTTTERP